MYVLVMSQLTSLPGSWLGLLRKTMVRNILYAILVLTYFVTYHSLNPEDNYQI